MVVYDGECPFCSAYVKVLRLQALADKVELIDARGTHPLLAEIREQGFDLNQGMVVKIGDRIAHGDAAMTELALLTGSIGCFNRFHYWVFSDSRRAATLYPILRAGRNAALRMLGRNQI